MTLGVPGLPDLDPNPSRDDGWLDEFAPVPLDFSVIDAII